MRKNVIAAIVLAALLCLLTACGGNEAPLERTNDREDYGSDEAFANFRAVTCGDLGENALYRSSSPVDPGLGRASYADALLREHHIRTALDLADSQSALESFLASGDMASSCCRELYDAGRVTACGLSGDYGSETFRRGVADCLRAIVQGEGPYLLHCIDGSEQTGFVAALLECLMGATWDEVVRDYMLSYENYYHVAPDSADYGKLRDENLAPVLEAITGAGDASRADLKAAAASYILGLGVSGGELRELREVLGRSYRPLPDRGVVTAADRIIGHRGASGEEIEHTAASYDLAVQYGVKLLEQDVVISREGTLYVSHDLTANRIAGVDRLFSDMTDAEIDALRTEDGQRILKLSDVFDRYGDSVIYVIELKDSGVQVDRFAELVKQYGNADRIIVQCFHLEALEALEPIFPDMLKMYLMNDQPTFKAGLEADCVDILSAEKKLMSAENCRLAHSVGKFFCVWTIDSESEINTAIDIGADYYFTNFPGLAFAVEAARG